MKKGSHEASARTILFDTNIVVYIWDTREPQKSELAADAFRALASAGVLRLSTQVVGEFYNTASRRLPRISRELAAVIAAMLAEDVPVLGITTEISLEAIRASLRYGLPYWDAQLWATAKVNGIGLILTEDFTDGATIEGVRFANPFAPHFDLDALLPATAE